MIRSSCRRLLPLLLVLAALGGAHPADVRAAPLRAPSSHAKPTAVQPVPDAAAVTVNPHDGHEYVFWRSPHGQIDEAWFTTSWHGPINLGWKASSAPSAAVNSAGNQYVAWEGPGGHIFQATYSGHWGGPQDLTAAHHWGPSGTTSATPAIAVGPDSDHPSLFWRGPDGIIEESILNGAWQAPTSRGWSSASAPSAGVSAAGHQFVFWTSPNGDIAEAWNGTSWSPPRDLTRSLHWGPSTRGASAPTVAVNPGNGNQYVFWRVANDHIEEAWYAGGWHGPSDEGWRAASAPSAAVTAQGGQDVVWLWGSRIWEASPGTGAAGLWGLDPGSGVYAEVVETTKSLSQRLTTNSDVQFSPAGASGTPVVDVDDATHYQHVTGVGAAMTDTSAWLIHNQLSPSAASGLMTNLFTNAGVHLDFTLVPIGASDFTATRQPYSYDDVPAGQTDPTLASFSIAHDDAYVLPVLRQMKAIAPSTWTFAVPWSPPAWMKANHAFGDLGFGGTLLADAYQPLAQYFVKFLQAYAAAGVPIDALAPENEPRAAPAYPAMSFPEASEDQWLVQDLGPALQAAGLHPQIYGNDTSWNRPDYGQAVVRGAARSLLAGVAWHCYGGIPTVMSDLHRQAPGLDQIVTECAPNLTRYAVSEILIGALRDWASTVTLWNIATDPSGGPVQAPNTGCHGCRGIVTISEQTHKITYGLGYYQLGQLGRFVEAGATRIASTSFVRFFRSAHNYGATAGLDDLALLNPDGSRVLVVYNNSPADDRFTVRWRGSGFAYSLPAGATVTFRWNP